MLIMGLCALMVIELAAPVGPGYRHVSSKPVGEPGKLFWQPRVDQTVSAKHSPSRWTEEEVAAHALPHCPRLRQALEADRGTENYALETVLSAYDHPLSLPCLLKVFTLLAEPAISNSFDMADLVGDIERRLDLTTFPSSMGPRLDRDAGPVFLPFLLDPTGTPGRWTERSAEADGLSYLSFFEARESWYIAVWLYGVADWTGDGRADVLVLWKDEAIRFGSYHTEHPMVLVANDCDGIIEGVDIAVWLRANKDRVLAVLAGQD